VNSQHGGEPLDNNPPAFYGLDRMKPLSPRAVQWIRGVLFVSSAAVVAVALDYGRHDARVLFGLAALLLIVPARRYWARRSLTALLRSGDVTRLLNAWDAAARVGTPAGRPAERLIRATALASYGWTKRARQLLDLAHGTAGEGLEHRVFLEVLLTALEGNHARSMQMAVALSSLPLGANPRASQRAELHRNAALALARAFAGCGTKADDEVLDRAGRDNPVLFWPTRYARAHLGLQHGNRRPAKRLVRVAPSWPEQSVFRQLTRDLSEALE
jgi:hypothetical protein